MSESNGDWGKLAESDDGLAATWDGFQPLPEAGENEVLDAFCKSKRITIASLLRLGARLSDPTTLAYAYDEAIKYRNMLTGKMWSTFGGEFPRMKIVPQGAQPTDHVIVCEGETDAARLTLKYPLDVAILPAGARRYTRTYAEQLSEYATVYVALDPDFAGEAGAAKIMESTPNCIRFKAPRKDWCSTPDRELPELPDPELSSDLLVPARKMLEMEVPEQASWYENDILPIGGTLILHGWAKGFKSWATIDMMARLSQGQDWCCFEPMEEPARVAIIQFELPWAYYRERVERIVAQAPEPELLKDNFYTWTPLSRPHFVAGDKIMEDKIIKALLDEGIQIVLVDPIRRATGPIDMNSEQEVRVMLNFFQRMNNEGITVVATHHDNKDSGRARGGTALGMTGSGAFAGDPDTIVSIELPAGQDWNTSTKRNLHFTLRNSPPIAARGMEIGEDAKIIYSNEPFLPKPDEVQDHEPKI